MNSHEYELLAARISELESAREILESKTLKIEQTVHAGNDPERIRVLTREGLAQAIKDATEKPLKP